MNSLLISIKILAVILLVAMSAIASDSEVRPQSPSTTSYFLDSLRFDSIALWSGGDTLFFCVSNRPLNIRDYVGDAQLLGEWVNSLPFDTGGTKPFVYWESYTKGILDGPFRDIAPRTKNGANVPVVIFQDVTDTPIVPANGEPCQDYVLDTVRSIPTDISACLQGKAASYGYTIEAIQYIGLTPGKPVWAAMVFFLSETSGSKSFVYLVECLNRSDSEKAPTWRQVVNILPELLMLES